MDIIVIGKKTFGRSHEPHVVYCGQSREAAIQAVIDSHGEFALYYYVNPEPFQMIRTPDALKLEIAQAEERRQAEEALIKARQAEELAAAEALKAEEAQRQEAEERARREHEELQQAREAERLKVSKPDLDPANTQATAIAEAEAAKAAQEQQLLEAEKALAEGAEAEREAQMEEEIQAGQDRSSELQESGGKEQEPAPTPGKSKKRK